MEAQEREVEAQRYAKVCEACRQRTARPRMTPLIALQRLRELGEGAGRHATAMLDVLRAAHQGPPCSEKYFIADYHRLVRCPDVARVIVSSAPPQVKVLTFPIFRSLSGRTFEIGDFEITIQPRGHPMIRNVRNTCPNPEMDHPLVSAGQYCLGTLSNDVLSAILRGELAVAFMLLILFLKEGHPIGIDRLAFWKEVK